MGKYRSSARVKSAPKSDGMHAIWRGIGCFMMIIIPAISIAAGNAIIKYGINHRWPIPYQLLGTPLFPGFFYKSTGLMTILSPVVGIENFYAIVLTSVIFMILLSGIISVIYGVIYNLTGPARYGPTDEPPPKIKTRKYIR